MILLKGAHLSLWAALLAVTWGCGQRASERDLPETIYENASYEFEAVPWGATDSAMLGTFRERGLRYQGKDAAGFRVFQPGIAAGDTRVLAWSDSTAGLARVTVISTFVDSSHSLLAFHDSLVRLTERYGPPVRQQFGRLRSGLVAFGDWWDQIGHGLRLTWRRDIMSPDSARYLIIVDRTGPGWLRIAPKPE